MPLRIALVGAKGRMGQAITAAAQSLGHSISAALDQGDDLAAGIKTSDEGNEPVNTPHYTFNLWSTWDFGHGWRAGLGVDGLGERYANQTNANVVPSYVRWDSMIEYSTKQYTLQLNLMNMLDEEYYAIGLDVPVLGGYIGVVAPGAVYGITLRLYH